MKDIAYLLMHDDIKDTYFVKSIICNYSSINEFDENLLKYLNLDINVVELLTTLLNLKNLSLTKSFNYYKYEIIKNPNKYIKYSDFHSQEVGVLRIIEEKSTRDEYLELLNNLKGSEGFELYLRHEYVISFHDVSKNINKYFPEIKQDYIDFIINDVNEHCSFYSLGKSIEEFLRIEEKELAIKLFNDNLINCVNTHSYNENFNIYKTYKSYDEYLTKFKIEINHLLKILQINSPIPEDELFKYIKDLTMKNNIPKNEHEIEKFTREFGNNKYAMLQ